MPRTEVTGRQIKDKSVSLADDVVDVLPVANGGSGVASLASGSVLVGAGTNPVSVVFPGTTGNVLTSNGSTWVSTAPSVPDLSSKQSTSEKGQANGYASLDSTARVPIAQLPPGLAVDSVARTDGYIQFYSGEVAVGEPIYLDLDVIDGGTASSSSVSTFDGGTP